MIGASAGVTLTVLAALIFVGFLWYSSRPVPWNKSALSVVWSEAHETFDLNEKIRDFKHAGFSLDFALQNNTKRDITIPADATIMKHLLRGGTLAEETAAKPYRSYFVPAHERAMISVQLDYGCSDEDFATGAVHARDPRVCFSEAFADSDGLVLFDHNNRIEVTLPKPGLR